MPIGPTVLIADKVMVPLLGQKGLQLFIGIARRSLIESGTESTTSITEGSVMSRDKFIDEHRLHRWQEPLDRIVTLVAACGVAMTAPEMGEPINPKQPHAGQPWWQGTT